jgi:hypothetical protein
MPRARSCGPDRLIAINEEGSPGRPGPLSRCERRGHAVGASAVALGTATPNLNRPYPRNHQSESQPCPTRKRACHQSRASRHGRPASRRDRGNQAPAFALRCVRMTACDWSDAGPAFIRPQVSWPRWSAPSCSPEPGNANRRSVYYWDLPRPPSLVAQSVCSYRGRSRPLAAGVWAAPTRLQHRCRPSRSGLRPAPAAPP